MNVDISTSGTISTASGMGGTTERVFVSSVSEYVEDGEADIAEGTHAPIHAINAATTHVQYK